MAGEGLVVVVSAPSGAGKTTLCRQVVERNRDCVFSVSVTTRPRRGQEQDGQDYHFTTEADFKRMIEKKELAEWAVVHDEYYGTTRAQLQTETAQGRTVILDIDVQGGIQIKQQFPNAVMIFILPPTFEELKQRLVKRRTESDAQIAQRMTTSRKELAQVSAYSYVIVNDDLAGAVAEFESIIQAEKCRLPRRKKIIQQFTTI